MASPFILVSLVLSLVCVSRVLAALECPEETAGSGPSYELVPVSPSDSGHMLMTASADEARNTAVCHAICIKYIFESQGSPNGSNGTAPTNGTSDTDSSTIPMEGVFQPNCKQFKQYLDCRSGCIAQSEGQACPGVCSGRCQDICSSDLGCFGSSVENNDCGVGCKESDCSEGCQRFSNLPSSDLPKPVNPPMLTRLMDNQQIYDIGNLNEIENKVYDNPSLVFRIEDQSQPGEYVYQWMVDVMFDLPEITVVEYLLNLNTFIGRRVNIAYAFATEQGLSEYSDTVELRLFREIVPVSPSDSGHALVTRDADEAQNTALCHVFCIDSLFQSVPVSGNNSNTTSNNGTVSVNGTTTTPTPILEGVVSLNCIQFEQYLDCRSGCIAQPQSQENCATTCSGRCQGICGSDLGCFGSNIENNDCGVNCNAADCTAGCDTYSRIPQTHSPPPMTAPELTRMAQNIYDVSIPSELEILTSGSSSLVFRIEDSSQPGEYVYQWMVDVMFDLPEITMIEFLLDLASYSGRSLNISYAFATDNGLSEYSESAIVQIPDQCVVVALTQSEVDIDDSLDERAGFFTHYVLNVSWCPTTCTELVAHYVVTRSTRTGGGRYCGETVTAMVDAAASSVQLESSNSRQLELPCSQTVQVQTVLMDGTTQEVSENIRLPAFTGGFPGFPELEIVGCPATSYDPQSETYVVDFQWRVPFSPAALSHIELLAIHVDKLLRLNDDFNDFSPLQLGLKPHNVYVNPNFDDITYNYTTNLSPLEDKDEFYQFGIVVMWMTPSGPGRSDNCRPVGTFAPPPFPIQVINVTSIETVRDTQISDELQDVVFSLSVHWEEPEVQYRGDINYEIYVGQRALALDEQPDEETRKNIDTDNNDDGSQTDTLRRTFVIPLTQLTVNAFLQMRSRQFDDFPSNWSTAMEIQFIVVRQPDPVKDLTIDFTTVDVVCSNNQTFLELDVGATWSEASIPEGTMFDSYEFSVKNLQITRETEFVDLNSQRIALDEPPLDIKFQIRVVVSFMGQTRKSFSSSVTERFELLPYPENITVVVAKNPRLKQLKSSDMLNMSVELSLDWDQPQSEQITSYEIYTTGSFVCTYDRFGERAGTVVNGSLTKFGQTFSALVADPTAPMLVLVYSISVTITL